MRNEIYILRARTNTPTQCAYYKLHYVDIYANLYSLISYNEAANNYN